MTTKPANNVQTNITHNLELKRDLCVRGASGELDSLMLFASTERGRTLQRMHVVSK